MKRTNHAYDVHVATERTSFSVVAKSRGDAVKQVRQAAFHRANLRFLEAVRKEKRHEVIAAKRKEVLGAVSRCFKPSDGGWKGVFIECRDERTATLPQGGDLKFSPVTGNSKWHRRMEAAGIESHGNPKPQREAPKADGKFSRRFVRQQRSEIVTGVRLKDRKRPAARRQILAAVAKVVQARLDANSREARAVRNVAAAKQRDKVIRARAEAKVAA